MDRSKFSTRIPTLSVQKLTKLFGDFTASDSMYDLKLVQETCRKRGVPCSFPSSNEVDVELLDGVRLVFANLIDENDTYLGFNDVPWHSHDNLTLMTGDATYIDFTPSELIDGLADGDVLIVTRYVGGQLNDRWLVHRKEKFDLQYIEPNEELCIASFGKQSQKIA